MIKAVLFDMDGILYDSEGFYMANTVEVMRSLGYQGPEEALYTIVGATAEKTWQVLYDLLEGEYTGKQIEQQWIAYNREHPFDYRKAMFADIPKSLARLHESGMKMACCSSSLPSVIEDSLEAMNIRKYFSFVISAEDVTHAKPDPEIYLKAALKLGLSPEECAVYEDSTVGIEAGRRAGMRVIARKDSRFHMDQSHADRIVNNASEMADDILGGNRNERSH